jgi:zinc transporter 1/2/3
MSTDPPTSETARSPKFGVLFHSVLVGLALAVDEGFTILFVVLIFHQTFEGLGLGSRLAYLELPGKWNKQGPYLMALIFGLATPVGIAAGLGIRQTYAPNGATANIAAGIFDSLSAGVLIYTGLVEVRHLDLLFCVYFILICVVAACARIFVQQGHAACVK